MKTLVVNCSPVRNGATSSICQLLAKKIEERSEVKMVCIDDYDISYCRGCRSCHKTAKCCCPDGTYSLMEEFEKADRIVCVAPSYWADVPGQFKCFIDRCTPWCNTHEPHAKLSSGKKGFSVVLRTGPNMKECERLISTIEHFYGHLEIECTDSIGFTGIEGKSDVPSISGQIEEFCMKNFY